MQLNWGTGITAFIIFFLVSTIAVVLYLMTIDVNLVSDNYYENEIKYQEQMDKIERSNNLDERINIKVENRNIIISYPKNFDSKNIKGSILCYRPSSNRFDRDFLVDADSNYLQIIKTDLMIEGMWKVKIDWEVSGTTYYNEEIIMLR